MATLYVDNDMRLLLTGRGRLKDGNGDPVTGATVEATIYERGADTGVSGMSWPITLSEGDEDGEYAGTIYASANIQPGKTYELEITATGPDGAQAKWVEGIGVEHRRF